MYPIVHLTNIIIINFIAIIGILWVMQFYVWNWVTLLLVNQLLTDHLVNILYYLPHWLSLLISANNVFNRAITRAHSAAALQVHLTNIRPAMHDNYVYHCNPAQPFYRINGGLTLCMYVYVFTRDVIVIIWTHIVSKPYIKGAYYYI